MKCGDIVRNFWASEDNPSKNFIFLKHNGKYVKVLALDGKNKIRSAQYYSSDLKNDTEHYQVVGHIPLQDMVIDALISANDIVYEEK